jgi:membrane-associated PAP2 superfamily phosphatase
MSATILLKRWLSIALMCVIISAPFLILLGQYSDLDLVLADLYFDTQTYTFPWDTTWFARDFMHGYVKNVIVWTGYLLVVTMLLDSVRPFARLDSVGRAKLRVIALASVIEPALIVTLKHHSNMHCPWGIQRYGGSSPFLRLLDTVPDAWQAGHCFPAGQASAGMWLCALAVFWLPQAPRRASAVFAGGLFAGLFMGWVQQMRGQHFLTHTLWTTWLSSAVVIALIAVFSRQLEKRVTQQRNYFLKTPLISLP